MDPNPYQPPLLDEATPPQPLGRPVRIENRFVDAFVAGWWLIRRNALRVAVVVLIVWLPIQAFLTYQELFVLKPDDFAGYFRLVRLTEGFLGVIGTGAVIALGVGCWETGRPIRLGEAFSASFAQWGRFFLGGIVGMFLLAIGLLLVVLPGVFIAICLGWLYLIYIVERCGITDGLRRSAEITQRHFWFSLALMIATTAVALVFGIGEGIGTLLTELAELPPTLLWLTNTLLGLPTYYAVACTWLVITAALLRIWEEEQASAPPEMVPD